MSEKTKWSIKVGEEWIEVRGWPERPFCASKVYFDGRRHFAVNGKGEFFCTSVQHGSQTRFRPDGKCLAVLRGVAKLGGCSKKVVAALDRHHERARIAYQRGWNAATVREHAEVAGIKLTTAQLQQIKKLERAGNRVRGNT